MVPNITGMCWGMQCVPLLSMEVIVTDYGVYMISFSVNRDRYWTLSSYVHVLRTVSGGSFIIPLFQGSNDMNQNIDTGTNIYTINCSNRGGSLKIMKICTY